MGEFLPVTDPVLIFALLMLTALIAPLLSARVRLPGIIGLIVAGVLIGPYGLGILERGPEVQILGTVGLLYIMFLAGLELDIVQFIRHRGHSLVFGAFTFIIPLALGTLMGRYLLGFTWPASILLSSMFSSHTLLTYPIASRLGLSRQRAVTTTIGGTLITDTAALLVLAVIAASHQGETGLLFWSGLFSYMTLYVVGVLLILPRVGRWFFREIATDGVIAFTGVLAAVFICAYMAYVSGLEPIIGAFLAGLVLNSLIPDNSALMNRIQFVGHSLFIPFFLISVGMLVHIRLLLSGAETVVIAGSMVFAGIVTKWTAASASRRLLSYTRDEGMLIFGLSVNQAAATLAAVLVGYNLGIFEEPVLTGTIIMILITSLAGSWLTDRYARAVALTEEDKPYSPSSAPHRILIPLSNPDTAEELMSLAMLMRRKTSHEPLYPLAIAESGDHMDARIAEAEKLLGYAVVRAISADVPVIPITRAAIDVATGIQQAIIDQRISTVIVGWKGRSTHSRTFGRILDAVKSGTRQMLLVSSCAVPINTAKRVVLAVPPLIEHQPGFGTAVRAVKTLASQLGTTILTVSVPGTMESARDVLENAPPKLQEEEFLLDRWDQLLPFLKNELNEKDDLLVLLNVRKGRLAWQPSLSRLPRLVSSELPAHNFVVIFPPEAPQEEIADFGRGSLLPRSHIRMDLSGYTIFESLSELLRAAFPGRDEMIRKLAKSLTEMTEIKPMELSPGVVLLHAHIPEVLSSTAFLGINRKGWQFPFAATDAQALFLLLSPKDASPEVHLKALASLVGPIHHKNAAEILSGADSADDILRIFSPQPE